MKPISWEESQQVELRIETITDVLGFPEAGNPAYILHVDFVLIDPEMIIGRRLWQSTIRIQQSFTQFVCGSI